MWIENSDSNAPPWLIPAPEGTAKFIASGETRRHFQIASNEFGSPKILVCPADKERRPAANWRNFSNTNLSYFANMTAGWFLSAAFPPAGGKAAPSSCLAFNQTRKMKTDIQEGESQSAV